MKTSSAARSARHLAIGVFVLGVTSCLAADMAASERIEVTGTRIPISDEQSPSPIVTFRAEDIALDGYPTIELFLNTLPQVFMGQGNRWGNFATGTSEVDLRGIGAARTLVLVNGRRLPAGSPISITPDLNQIPVPLIRRVEVLTGGASAVYGSDALTGVVNFIMNDRFQGVHGEIGHDFYNHKQKSWAVQDALRARNFEIPGDKAHDGASTRVNLAIGGDFAGDRGNASMFLGYFETEALPWGDRDYSACALNAAMRCGGVDTGFPGAFRDESNFRAWTMNPDGSVRPYVAARDAYNFAPLNHFQRPNERYSAAAFMHYDLASRARVYAEFSFHDDRTYAQVAPTAVFGYVANVRRDNPLLTDDWRARLVFLGADGAPSTDPGAVARVLILRRNVEGGPREADIRHTSYRPVVGVKGALAENWDYDAFFQTGKVLYQQTYRREFSNTRIGRALDVVPHPGTGNAVCASVLDGTDPGCVPYNVWTPTGVTQGALDYLQSSGLQNGYTSQRLGGATVKGRLNAVRLPGASEGVSLALGVEARKDELRLQTDTAFATGDLSGQGGSTLPVEGQVGVKEIFGEVRAPLGEQSGLSASYRYSDYDTGFSTDTFGIGANLAPVPWLRIRGAYQVAIRAPNVVELFAPQDVVQGTNFDPCAGASPARSAADCARTGVTAALYGNVPPIPSGLSAQAVRGGNPELQPEDGTSRTLGVAWEPGSGFAATIDYWDIRLKDGIGVLPDSIVLDECLNTGDPAFCSLIRRDPATGSVWLGQGAIVAPLRNLGGLRMRGVDVGASFSTRLGEWGGLMLDGIGTYLLERSTEPLPHPAGAFDCVGLHAGACGSPAPEWRHRVRLTWSTPWSLDLALTWRHFGSVEDAASSSHPVLARPVVRPPLKAMNYVDLAFTWQFTRNFMVRAGINNIADLAPPLSNSQTNGNTWAHTYDALGRHVFATLTAKF